MVLPIGRIIAQVIVPLVAVLARAIPAAYSQAIQNARRNGVDATQTATTMLRREVSKSEALQILNLSEAEATAEAVEKQFEKYFAANAVEKGGSFYLQSKVYRAKQMLDQFIAEKKLEDKEAREKEASQK
ncbi:Pam16 [Fragilaria crotonensis]|nr:Pam16 [Fragilaria crotonensis]